MISIEIALLLVQELYVPVTFYTFCKSEMALAIESKT